MAALLNVFDDDDLREDCEQDAQLEKETRPYCEQCGEFVDRLTMVEDRDDSVEYRDMVPMCDGCIERIRRRR